MASYGHAAPAAAYGAPPMTMLPGSGAPAGTFSPGTKIQCGGHRVVIQKYLSEGGFAHVYLVKMPKPVDGTDLAVLKRVAVSDKEALKAMRTEVETMKRLKGHRPIVTYIDSHASELRGGGYEVFLLMEYCDGGGLIDFMNTRLQHRLTEPEILKIFTDVAEGVACMHYLKPPLLHRDLKVENVLITTTGSSRKFKLCDFGSAANPKPAPMTVEECRLIDEDVQKHTTMQYRSPEMIDVYRKQPIDEKSDIWALGVLLYKLCYYTTPFEDQGQLAILNASYRFPSHPAFSDKLKKLIAWMLMEHPQARPNIYQVLKQSCSMQGRQVPIKDIYAGASHSAPRSQDKVVEKVVGAVFSPPPPQEAVLPDVVPMRRGRLPAASSSTTTTTTPASQPVVRTTKPSPSPMRVTDGDPFAALDAKVKSQGVDELSHKFPTLDQFSILHEHGTKFDFDRVTSPTLHEKPSGRPLADEAFAVPQSKPNPPGVSHRPSGEMRRGAPSPDRTHVVPPVKSASVPLKTSEMSLASSIIKNTPELQAISSGVTEIYQPSPGRPSMVSTGTMTATPPPERPATQAPYQVYRFTPSDHSRSSSLPRQQSPMKQADNTLNPRPTASPRISSFQGHVRQPSSSRPSLEGGRPSMEMLEPTARTRTLVTRQRPASTHLESNLDFLRERENNKPNAAQGMPSPRFQPERMPSPALLPDEETNITSNVDFLRSMEESEPRKSKESKRSSLTSLGKKNIFAGKFGDAFKRFEGNQNVPPPLRTPSPFKDLQRRDLTPIAGSEATDGRSDDGQVLEETEDMTPEMRREIERLRLAQEERRVAAAQAEHRARVAQRELTGSSGARPTPPPKSIGGVSRAFSIQNKVQTFIEENSRSANIKRTAEGYGQYTDSAASSSPPAENRPEIPRKPLGTGRGSTSSPRPMLSSDSLGAGRSGNIGVESRPTLPPKDFRPAAPPKPTHLNKHSTSGSRPGSPAKASGLPPAIRQTGRLEALIAADLPGAPIIDMTAEQKEDYIRDFSTRFPSLTSIEMVERDLAAEGRSGR